MKRVSNFALAAGIALCIVAVPAMAADRHDSKIRVSYKDLNIHSEAGAKVLYARLKRASEEACGSDQYIETRSLRLTRLAQQCYAETLDIMVGKVDSAELEKLHTS